MANERPAYVTCPECGGYAGCDAATFGDRGWHPCYHCGASRVITRAEALRDARYRLEANRASREWHREREQEEAALAEQRTLDAVAEHERRLAYYDTLPF